MSIRNFWFNYKIRSIEVFLMRAFRVDDEYTQSLDFAETEDEYDDALDMVLAYQDIVFRAVYSELNSLVELELKSLAKSILESKGNNNKKITREKACTVIEQHYGINLSELSGFEETDEVRKIMNAYKHDDGFSRSYEEVSPNLGWLVGHYEARYKLSHGKAYRSIKSVNEFMKALPGDRQEFPEVRLKSEDQQTIEIRKKAWADLRQSGVLGHVLEQPVLPLGAVGNYQAACQLCGKIFYHEHEGMLPLVASLDKCPGASKSQ